MAYSEAQVRRQLFLTSALEEGEQLASRLSRLTLRGKAALENTDGGPKAGLDVLETTLVS